MFEIGSVLPIPEHFTVLLLICVKLMVEDIVHCTVKQAFKVVLESPGILHYGILQ